MASRTLVALAALVKRRITRPDYAALARQRVVAGNHAALARQRVIAGNHASFSGSPRRPILNVLAALRAVGGTRAIGARAALGSTSGALLRASLPQNVYGQSGVMTAVLQAQGTQLDALLAGVGDALNAQYVLLAPPWALTLWEAELGLQTVPTQTLSQRQQRILALLAGGAIPTLAFVTQVASTLAGSQAVIYEDFGAYTVHVTYPQSGNLAVANVIAITNALRAIIPAHLEIEIHAGGLTWDDLDLLGWAWNFLDPLQLTWNQLENY